MCPVDTMGAGWQQTSDRKVLMGIASAATAASWNTLNRTRSRNGTMPRPRYSTCFGGGDGGASGPAALTTLRGLCFRSAAWEAAAAPSWLAAASLPALLLNNVAVLSFPAAALQPAVLGGASAFSWPLRATLVAEVVEEKWQTLRMLSAAAGVHCRHRAAK